ncbi:hypothetical protein FGIG_06531 [Fasciola gigantica]|uniref:Uncharacterized protein n=1 Tax=Fasciola gigantica TaxID=46835 RepID=A0A504Z870_FASGI|nr:hypothetical protein FGIG_06531 [Fasciola gigantica]
MTTPTENHSPILNGMNGTRSGVTPSDSSNSLELLQPEDTDNLLSVVGGLPDSDMRNTPKRLTPRSASGGQPTVKQRQFASTSQLTAGKSRLVQPSRLTRPGTVSNHNRSSSEGMPVCSASLTTLNQLSKPSSTSRRIKPISASPLVSRTSRTSTASTTTTITRPSGLRAPSTVGTARAAMTCPPSASGRSLASSRSASTTGSVNNLTTTNGLQSRRAAAAHAVSAQSVCAALHKRERTVAIAKPIIRPQPTAQAKSGLQSVGTHSSASTYKPKGVVSGSVSSTLTTESANGSDMSTEVPKPIRGGRKSLTGRKPDSRQLLNNAHVKPVYKPKSVENRTNSIPDGTLSSSPNPQTSTSPASSPYGTSHSRRSVALGSVESTPNGILSDSNQDSSNGMWIVRGELSLVNGLK